MTTLAVNSDVLASPHLRHGEGELLDIATHTVAMAERLGVAAAAHASESGGLTVTARDGRAELRTGDQVQRLAVTVYDGLRQGHASTGRFDREAVEGAIERAAALAKFGGEDAEAVLPENDLIARNPRTVPLFRTAGWSADELTAHAVAIEAAAQDAAIAKGVELVVDNAGTSTHDHRVALAASNGFAAAYSSSTASRWASVAAGVEGNRRVAFDGSSQRNAAQLRASDLIGAVAVSRAARMLGARSVAPCRTPVLFENLIARDLVGSLVGALSGGAQMHGGTFLPGCIGQSVIATHLSLHEDPFVPFGAASAPFDGEGIAGIARDVIANGVAQSYFLGMRSARRLGMASTGSASGPYNVRLSSNLTRDGDDQAAMLRKLGTGLFITSLSNQGVNMFTGDWSRAASGFWVENGVIAFPVEGVTISGNLKAMLMNIVGLGTDRTEDGPTTCGSILIDALDLTGA